MKVTPLMPSKNNYRKTMFQRQQVMAAAAAAPCMIKFLFQKCKLRAKMTKNKSLWNYIIQITMRLILLIGTCKEKPKAALGTQVLPPAPYLREEKSKPKIIF